MKLKPRFSKNKKSDALRFSIAGLAFFALFMVAWNRLATPLGNLKKGYHGYVLRSETLNDSMINEAGVMLIKEWLEQRTRPIYNPITIIHHTIGHKKQAPYYEFIMGLKGHEGANDFREYGIYLAGHTLYLQVEPIGTNRVLKTTFSPAELEEALSLYIEGTFETRPLNQNEQSVDASTPHVSSCSLLEAMADHPVAQLLRPEYRRRLALTTLVHPTIHNKHRIVHRHQCH